MITKDNKGITLIALILTIIIMLILATVTTYTGIDTYKESKVYAFVSQMQLIQAKVDDLVNTKTIDELKVLGEDIAILDNATEIIDKVYNNGEITQTDTETNVFRYFSEQTVLDELDIEEVENGLIINFTTREVISITGIEHEGKKYYTQYKLPNGQELINGDSQINRELDFNLNIDINGINSTVSVSNISITNGMIDFAEVDLEENIISNWQTITNYTEKQTEYTTAISKSGNYIFRVQDNTDRTKLITKTISILLTNKPKTDLLLEYNYGLDSDSWAYASDENGNNYVWIPRFAYDTNNNIKFIKGNSNIATDDTYIDEDTWTVPEKFISVQDGTELTGVWIRVDSAVQTGLDMILVLNNAEEVLIEI